MNSLGCLLKILQSCLLCSAPLLFKSSSINAELSVSVTYKELTVGIRDSNATVCEAYGDTNLTLIWKFNGNPVRMKVEPFVYQAPTKYSTLEFFASRKLVIRKGFHANEGTYICVASDSKRKRKTAKFVLKVPPTLSKTYSSDTRITMKDRSLALICMYVATPLPDVYWLIEGYPEVLTHETAKPGLVIETAPHARYSKTVTSKLKISQSFCLGKKYSVSCWANNTVGRSLTHTMTIVSDFKVQFQGIYYIFAKKMGAKNYPFYSKICTNYGGILVGIKDQKVQQFLTKQIDKKIREKTWRRNTKFLIGAVETNGIWKWSDGNFMYNQTKYKLWTENEASFKDGSFVAWNRGEPRVSTFVMLKKIGTQWRWTTASSGNSFSHVICEVKGTFAPSNLIATSPRCDGTVINITWETRGDGTSDSIGYEVTAIPVNDTSANNATRIGTTNDIQNVTMTHESLTGMKPATVYDVQVTLRQDWCSIRPTYMSSVTTGKSTCGPDLRSSYEKVAGTNKCRISVLWRKTASCPITHILFNVTASHRRLPANGKLMPDAQNGFNVAVNESTVTLGINHTFRMKPNKQYSVVVQEINCRGRGETLIARGECLSDADGPDEVPDPRLMHTSFSGNIAIDIRTADESNGLITCYLVIGEIIKPSDLTKNKSTPRVDSKFLESISVAHRNETTKTEQYFLAAAVGTTKVRNDSVMIGPMATSSCNPYGPDMTFNATSTDKSFPQIYQSESISADAFAVYSFFIVTTTPTEQGELVFKTSSLLEVSPPNAYMRSNGNSQCEIVWKEEPIDDILHKAVPPCSITDFRVNISTLENYSLVHAKITTSNRSGDFRYVFEMEPGKNYSVTIQAATCYGLGPALPVSGECFQLPDTHFSSTTELIIGSSTATPVAHAQNITANVALLFTTTNDSLPVALYEEGIPGRLTLNSVSNPDPSGCYLIIATKLDPNQKDISKPVVNEWILQSMSNNTKSGYYIAMALHATEIAKGAVMFILGDGATSECSIKQGKRNWGYKARNRKLENGYKYAYFVAVIKVEPIRGVVIQLGEAFYFEYDAVRPNSFWLLAITLSSVLFLLIVIVTMCCLRRKRKKPLAKPEMFQLDNIDKEDAAMMNDGYFEND